MSLLSVKNLRIELSTRAGVAPVIDDLSFDLAAGEAISFVGESGCGKSMTALGLMGLLPEGIGRIAGGSITFDGEELTTASEARLRAIRGNDISMIFQEPMTSLNPVYTVGEQIAEVLREHQRLSRRAAWNMAAELLDAVRIPNAARRVGVYPFQMSGGQRQRIMMARAYMVKPRMIVADEPVSMVDASLRASILDVMMKLRDEAGISFLYITHDLSTAYQIGDRILLFYQGTLAAEGNAVDVLSNPKHPYVQLLIDSVPKPDPTQRWEGEVTLPAEEELRTAASTGCRFVPRCPHATPACSVALPPLYPVGPNGHRASCVLHAEGALTPA